MEQKKLVANAPQAIIIEPSRELAEQTLKQIQKFKVGNCQNKRKHKS